MTISIIVPHYNDLAGLDRCLAALARQTFSAEPWEIVVADNASPQGEEAVAAVVRNRARLVTVRQKGAGPARNGGVAASTGEILAFTDSDCVPDPHWLEKGIEGLAHSDFVGGAVDVLVHDPSRQSAAESFEKVFAFDTERYVTQKGFVATCNLFCTRRVFDAVGVFENGISEDVDWSRRATGKGFRIGYVPEALVGHPARRDWSEIRKKWIRINAETYALTVRTPAGRLKWALVCLALPASCLVHTVKVLRSPKLKGLSQRAGALGMLYRLRFWRMLDSMRLLARGVAAQP
ncbi:MAG TPA: glycosyltransferase [Rhizomicrobium sp.]|nr:glycosyltransferase [Rhizomicrobium sp.]